MISCCLLEAHRSNHRKHRDIGLEFRYRSTPNTRRVTKNVVFFFFFFGGGYHIYIYMYLYSCRPERSGYVGIERRQKATCCQDAGCALILVSFVIMVFVEGASV